MKERVKYRQNELQDIILYICSIVDVSICGLEDYRCKNGRNCIHLSQVCDSLSNCFNVDSDQMTLSWILQCFQKRINQYIFSIVDVSICGLDDYRCKNGRNCIHLSQVCDSVNDCDDGDDEEFNLCSKFYSQ